MSARTNQTRQCVSQRKTRGCVAAPVRRAASNFLTIPTLAKKIPVKRKMIANEKEWLELAKLCSELVSDDELNITSKSTAQDIVAMCLSAWASRLCADIKVLDSFTIDAALDREVLSLQYEEPEKEKHWHFAMTSNQTTPFINVQTKLDELEKVAPGLARTVILTIEHAGYKTFPVFTPAHGAYIGENLYWYGSSDDNGFMEEFESMGDETPAEEIFLPSHYRNAFPDMYFTGDVLSPEALQSLISKIPEAKEVAEHILSIKDLIDQNAYLPGIEDTYQQSVYFAAYMFGKEVDENSSMFTKVLDDFYQSTSYGGEEYTDMYTLVGVPFDKTLFQQWRVDMEKGFLLYSKLDHLMQLVGEVRP